MKQPLAKRPAPPRCKLLVVHVGDHKTGSTSIQTAFAREQVHLGDRAVFYPTGLNHNFLRKACTAYGRGKGPAKDAAIRTFQRLARRIAKSGAPAALISAEALEGIEPGMLHEVLTTYFANTAETIRVVAYVRPHAARFLSNYAEQIKTGSFDGDLDAYHNHVMGNERLVYHPRFTAHAAVFGDGFILRPMIRDQLKSGSVLADFVHHAFGSDATLTEGAAPANESLSLEDLMRLKLLQAHHRHQPQKLRHALGWDFARLAATLPPPKTRTQLVLPKGLAARIHAACLTDARAMDAAFFDGAPLMEGELAAARDSAPDMVQPLEPEACFPPGEIRALTLLSQMVAELLDQDAVNWVSVLRGKRVSAAREDEDGDG